MIVRNQQKNLKQKANEWKGIKVEKIEGSVYSECIDHDQSKKVRIQHGEGSSKFEISILDADDT